jgi:hypothetical protein
MARHSSWFGASMDAWMLGIEASTVIGLRTMKIAAGGADGQAEASLMVTEKMESLWLLQARAMTGGLGTSPERAVSSTIAHYRRKVRANRRRLAG